MGYLRRGHELPAISDMAVKQRLLQNVKKVDSCWIWQGCLNKRGYGNIWYAGRSHLVHRVAYAIFRGTIEEGMTIDHICRVEACCNPAHLEAITKSENSKRRWQKCVL